MIICYIINTNFSCRWYNLDCAQQQDFYSLNQFLYQENTDTEDYDYGDLGRGKLKYIFMHNACFCEANSKYGWLQPVVFPLFIFIACRFEINQCDESRVVVASDFTESINCMQHLYIYYLLMLCLFNKIFIWIKNIFSHSLAPSRCT